MNIFAATTLLQTGDDMTVTDRLKSARDSIHEVLREVQRLQPSVPPLSQKVRNQLQSTTRKLKHAVLEIETVMRELNSRPADTRPLAAGHQSEHP